MTFTSPLAQGKKPSPFAFLNEMLEEKVRPYIQNISNGALPRPILIQSQKQDKKSISLAHIKETKKKKQKANKQEENNACKELNAMIGCKFSMFGGYCYFGDGIYDIALEMGKKIVIEIS
ncbi:hypothetical protein NC651_003982 [Populus alba x Populus x berolinensis]|nr:hypothetical protein NC651_003982 [Populus alba x Populus x berolinensis]